MSEVSFMRLMDVQAKPRVITDHNPAYISSEPKDPKALRDKFWNNSVPVVPKKYAIRKDAPKRDWMLIERTEVEIVKPKPNYVWKRILYEVAEKHNVSVEDIISPKRNPHIVRARYESFYRMRNETNLSLPAIGRRCGGRDHTTVMHGIKKYLVTHGEPVAPSAAHLREKGYEYRKAKTSEQNKEVEWMILQGVSLSRISHEMGMSRKRVARVRKAMGA